MWKYKLLNQNNNMAKKKNKLDEWCLDEITST